MHAVVQGVKRFWQEEEGASGVEYALLAGLIGVGFVAGATLLGGSINTLLTDISNCVSGAGPCP